MCIRDSAGGGRHRRRGDPCCRGSPPGRPRGPRGHPGLGLDDVPRLGGAPQGAHAQPRPPDERHLPAHHLPCRARRRRRRVRRQRHLPARAGRRGVRHRRTSRRPQSDRRAGRMSTLVVAVDLSTTAAKAVVQDAAGTVLAQATSPITTRQPHPTWHEQDAQEWWTATRDAISAAVSLAGEPVRALCLTHQRETFVCCDYAGLPLRPAILWLDGRAHEEIAELGSRHVHELSGKPPDTTPAIYKLAWLARHEPDVLRNAVHVGDVQAYLVWRLTGRWATSHGSADTLGLFDLQRMNWSAELLEIAGVRVDQLPDLVPAGDEIGTLSREIARSLCLPGPIPLVAGIGDGQAAGLGLGATVPGVAYLNLGTSMAVS